MGVVVRANALGEVAGLDQLAADAERDLDLLPQHLLDLLFELDFFRRTGPVLLDRLVPGFGEGVDGANVPFDHGTTVSP